MTDVQQLTETAKAVPGEKKGLVRGLGMFGAVSVNMSQMVGIGPFITIPLIIATMGGPQAMFGWIAGALIAICDGLVWAELGAAMPAEGGTYTYLREGFQYSTGRLMPFLFVWSTLLVTPLIMSTGMIGIAQYLAYFWHTSAALSHWEAVGFTILTVALLWRRIDSIGKLAKVLWAGMILTVGLVIVGAFTHFSARQAFTFPHGAFGFNHFFSGLGAGLVLAIFDYLGYYTIAYLGDETHNPGRVIPRSIVISVLGVMVIDLALNIGTMGVIPWQQAEKSTAIGSDLMRHVWGGPAAAIVTLLIVWTAFASVYTGLLGASRLPFNAAKEGVFFRPFARLHPRLAFPHISLLAMGVVTAIACFFSLTTIINALIAMAIWVQFIGQIVALTILRRKQPGLLRPYRQWLYPIPSLIALVGWIYIFHGSGWPAIRIMIGWTVAGMIAYIIWAKVNRLWPFGPKEIHEEFLAAPADSDTTSTTHPTASAAEPVAR